MKYKFCRIRINVTNMTSHLPQRWGFNPQPPWLRNCIWPWAI